MSVISVRSWWIGHRGFSLRPKLSVRSFVRSFCTHHLLAYWQYFTD